MEYHVVKENHIVDLKESVNNFLKYGWKPLGGISVTVDWLGKTIFCQALIKED